MKHFRDMLPLRDWPRYFVWHRRQNKTFRCRLRNGVDLSIRPLPNHDFDTVFEVFFGRIYDCDLPHDQVRRVVDLGGNLGYSCLYWCHEYPNAKVLTFEPHPVHCRLLQWHMAQNRFTSRVQLIEAAVGTENGQARLEDADTASAIVSGDDGGSAIIPVPVVDIFPLIPEGTIDVLKIDIEGGEYPILMDSRFESLAQRTRRIHLEWHASVDKGGTLCYGRLASLGFNVKFIGYQDPERGMIYASRIA